MFGDFAESQSKDFKETIDEGEFAEDYGYFSDSDLEGDEDENISLGRKDKLEDGGKISREDHEERVEKGKVVKIPDMAYVT